MNSDILSRFEAAINTLTLTNADIELYGSDEGGDLIFRNVKEIFTQIENCLNKYKKELEISITRKDDIASLHVTGPGSLGIYVIYSVGRSETEGKNRLRILVDAASANASSMGEVGSQINSGNFRADFIPVFDGERYVLWCNPKTKHSGTSIAEIVLDQYLKHIERYVENRVLFESLD
jgi:hypothetical protein